MLAPGNILERFSTSRGVYQVVQGGLFLRKRLLKSCGFPLQQQENRYNPAPVYSTVRLTVPVCVSLPEVPVTVSV
jgi:hypothetical protein